jgi:serine-type D-Ala-D-Ala carboxypeptidase/endopeptidase (penicillin-binding protein 4)
MIRFYKYLFLIFLLNVCSLSAQTIKEKLLLAANKLENDEQLKNGIFSIVVVNTKTNEKLIEKNGNLGLAPASTQKIFTAIAAYDILGKDYSYNTVLGYNGKLMNGILNGDIILKGSGDPSLGSWRYTFTKDTFLLNSWMNAITGAGIKKVNGNIIIDDTYFEYQPLPGGWIWDDIGNYYGAGTWGFNWRENQYDIELMPGKQEGDATKISRTIPPIESLIIQNNILTGKKGSGDNGYIYYPPYSAKGFAEGTIPAGVNNFTISGAIPNPPIVFGELFKTMIQKKSITLAGKIFSGWQRKLAGFKNDTISTIITNQYSPLFDSLIYWFMQKSINLYGEAFLKTIAVKLGRKGHTDEGREVLKNFWQQKGIEKSAFQILDGSGLSPQNRVTSNSLVSALQYAYTRDWFQGFYKGLPLYNGMKLKSGTIGGAKSYAGYYTANSGETYTISIVVNNYAGSPSALVNKIL